MSLIGKPTAAAVPITTELLCAYSQWLFYERRLLLIEMFPDREMQRFAEKLIPNGSREADHFHFPSEPLRWDTQLQPSSRAAVVISAAGCELPPREPDLLLKAPSRSARE